MSKCLLCASMLLYSRDQCTVALGRCCSADACARSHRIYSAHCTVCAVLHCTVCAVLHYQHFVCCAALLGAVHCTALSVPCCAALCALYQANQQHTASPPRGSGQWYPCNAPPHCLWAVGSGAVLYCAVLCCAVLCCAVLYCAVLCFAVSCCVVLCRVVLCLSKGLAIDANHRARDKAQQQMKKHEEEYERTLRVKETEELRQRLADERHEYALAKQQDAVDRHNALLKKRVLKAKRDNKMKERAYERSQQLVQQRTEGLLQREEEEDMRLYHFKQQQLSTSYDKAMDALKRDQVGRGCGGCRGSKKVCMRGGGGGRLSPVMERGGGGGGVGQGAQMTESLQSLHKRVV